MLYTFENRKSAHVPGRANGVAFFIAIAKIFFKLNRHCFFPMQAMLP